MTVQKLESNDISPYYNYQKAKISSSDFSISFSPWQPSFPSLELWIPSPFAMEALFSVMEKEMVSEILRGIEDEKIFERRTISIS